MRIIDTLAQLPSAYVDGNFSLDAWRRYMDAQLPGIAALCEADLRECLAAGGLDWARDYLPVLNTALYDGETRERARASFHQVADGLEAQIRDQFGRCPEVDLILYLGLCNGAGWVVAHEGRTRVLLGVEKLVELGWCGIDDLHGLLWHELGHAYQAQFGTLERKFERGEDSFLWQLYTEGIAMRFEQVLAGDDSYYHQDRDDWKAWCDAHFAQICRDFTQDLPNMTFADQRWFGDWVRYEGRGDVGYYLAARFAQWLCRRVAFDAALDLDIGQLRALYWAFCSDVAAGYAP